MARPQPSGFLVFIQLHWISILYTLSAPRFLSAVFVRAGDEVVLPCFGRVDWLDSEAEMVQWKRQDLSVLEWVQGSLFVDPQFKGRALLPKERILQDNISLELKDTRHEDQGLYECSFVKNKAVRLAAQINLTVTDHMSRLEAGFGSSVPLPLHTVSPVIVRFLPDGGNSSVRVCEVEKEQMNCGAAYSHRTDLQQHSLELRKLSMEDSGTFSVMERETRRTVSVLFIRVFPPSTGPPGEAERGGKTIIIISVIAVVIVMVITVIMLRWWRQRRLTEIQEAEVHL